MINVGVNIGVSVGVSDKTWPTSRMWISTIKVSSFKNLKIMLHFIPVLEELLLLKQTVELVFSDNGFNLATEKTQKARLTASKLLTFLEDSEDVAESFAKDLVKLVSECCSHPKPVTCHTFRERMWEKFHKLTSSSKFRAMWEDFLHLATGIGTPIFYQFVTEQIMNSLIKHQLPLDKSSSIDDNPALMALDFEEANALRYCGGYLLRSLRSQVKKSKNPLKQQLLLCLEDLSEG